MMLQNKMLTGQEMTSAFDPRPNVISEKPKQQFHLKSASLHERLKTTPINALLIWKMTIPKNGRQHFSTIVVCNKNLDLLAPGA